MEASCVTCLIAHLHPKRNKTENEKAYTSKEVLLTPFKLNDITHKAIEDWVLCIIIDLTNERLWGVLIFQSYSASYPPSSIRVLTIAISCNHPVGLSTLVGYYEQLYPCCPCWLGPRKKVCFTFTSFHTWFLVCLPVTRWKKDLLDCLTKGILPTRTHHRLIGSLPSAVLSLTLSYPIEDCYASYIMVFAVSPILRIVLYAHHSYPREVLIDPSCLLWVGYK